MSQGTQSANERTPLLASSGPVSTPVSRESTLVEAESIQGDRLDGSEEAGDPPDKPHVSLIAVVSTESYLRQAYFFRTLAAHGTQAKLLRSTPDPPVRCTRIQMLSDHPPRCSPIAAAGCTYPHLTLKADGAPCGLFIDGPHATWHISHGVGRHDCHLHVCVHWQSIRATSEHQLDRNQLHALLNQLPVRVLIHIRCSHG